MGKNRKRNAKKNGSLYTQDLVPIRKIEQGVVEYKDGSYAKVVEVEPINFTLRSYAEQEDILYSFMAYLKVCPPVIRFKSITRRADIDAHINKIYEGLKDEPDSRPHELASAYAQLLRQLGSREALTRRFFTIIPYFGPKVPIGEVAVRLENDVTTLRSFLSQCGNNLKSSETPNMNAMELFYVQFNPASSIAEPVMSRINKVGFDVCAKANIDLSKMKKPPQIPPSMFVAPRGVDFTHPDYYIMDGMYYTHMYITADGYPNKVYGGWLSSIVNAGDGIEVDVQLERKDRGKTLEDVSRRMRMNKSRLKGIDDSRTDFEDLASTVASCSFIKASLQQNNEDLYYMYVLITVSDRTYKGLQYKTKQLSTILKGADIQVSSCKWEQEEALQTCLPTTYINKSIKRKAGRNVTTSGASSSYIFSSFEMTDENGVLMGLNKQNSTLCILDLFNSRIYKNANMVIIGTSGSGKTFTMQLMALRMRLLGIQSFIVAPFKGHEFKRACINIGGQYVKISPASSNCINLLEIRPIDVADEEYFEYGSFDPNQDTYLAKKTQQVKAFFSLLLPTITNLEETVLDEAIIECYRRKGITHDNESIFIPGIRKTKPMPILGDLYEVLSEKPEACNLATIIRTFVSGSAQSFNQQTNVDLDNKYIVIDISELSGKLLPVGMFIALDFVWDKVMADRTQKKAIFIDEVWKLIGGSSNQYAADFVLQIFKIIRGYGGAAITATQDLHDFFTLQDGKFGAGIVNNAKTKLVLDLEPDEADYVKNAFKLSDTEIRRIRGSERGEGLIISNSNKVTVKIIPSPLEQELITTDRAENEAIVKRKKAEFEALKRQREQAAADQME